MQLLSLPSIVDLSLFVPVDFSFFSDCDPRLVSYVVAIAAGKKVLLRGDEEERC
jgi:hypothetical protein